MKKNIILVLSGPSGVGKGTISAAVRRADHNIELSISATTRKPRVDEVDGVHYYFIDQAKFDDMIKEGAFAECVHKYNSSYGTPKSEMTRIISKGHDVLLDIEPIGAKNIKRIYPEAILIFVVPKSISALEERLWNRGSETKETFDRRMADFIKELNTADSYDYFVVNDVLDDAVNDVKKIIECERNDVRCDERLTANNIDKIQKLKRGDSIC